jgi:NADH-quinone oxidoreductase subunit L
MYALPNPLPARIASTIKPLYRASFRKFYIDEIYGLVVVGPTLLLAHLSALFDKHVIDGLVRRISTAPGLVGRDFFRPLQNGLVQMYAATTALGLVVLLILLMFV